MSKRDLAAVLRTRADGIRAVARQSYEHELREVMYKTAETFDEAADEISRLRFEIARLKFALHNPQN